MIAEMGIVVGKPKAMRMENSTRCKLLIQLLRKNRHAVIDGSLGNRRGGKSRERGSGDPHYSRSGNRRYTHFRVRALECGNALDKLSERRQGGHHSFGRWMGWITEQILGLPAFDNLSLVHHGYAVADGGHRQKIVRDVENAHA